jgi:hypothetical protein
MSERNTGDVALEPSINGFYPLAILLFLIVVGMVSQRLLFLQRAVRVTGVVTDVNITVSECYENNNRSKRLIKHSIRRACSSTVAKVDYPEASALMSCHRDVPTKIYSLEIFSSQGFQHSSFNNIDGIKLGGRVSIIYDSYDPRYAFRDTFWSIWKTPFMFVVALFCASVLSLVVPSSKLSSKDYALPGISTRDD